MLYNENEAIKAAFFMYPTIGLIARCLVGPGNIVQKVIQMLKTIYTPPQPLTATSFRFSFTSCQYLWAVQPFLLSLLPLVQAPSSFSACSSALPLVWTGAWWRRILVTLACKDQWGKSDKHYVAFQCVAENNRGKCVFSATFGFWLVPLY